MAMVVVVVLPLLELVVGGRPAPSRWRVTGNLFVEGPGSVARRSGEGGPGGLGGVGARELDDLADVDADGGNDVAKAGVRTTAYGTSSPPPGP